MKNTNESKLVNGLLEALYAKRVFCWRNNSGKLVIGKGTARRFVDLGPAGAPDILGVLPGGRLFGLECKGPKGKLSESQFNWHAQALAIGAKVATVRSITDGIVWVQQWTQEAREERAAVDRDRTVRAIRRYG